MLSMTSSELTLAYFIHSSLNNYEPAAGGCEMATALRSRPAMEAGRAPIYTEMSPPPTSKIPSSSTDSSKPLECQQMPAWSANRDSRNALEQADLPEGVRKKKSVETYQNHLEFRYECLY